MRFTMVENAGGGYDISVKLDDVDKLPFAVVGVSKKDGQYLAFNYLCAFDENDDSLARLAAGPSDPSLIDLLAAWPREKREQFKTLGAMVRNRTGGLKDNPLPLEIILGAEIIDAISGDSKYEVVLGKSTLRVESAKYTSNTSQWPIAA
jgi:hypothetical protein